MLRNYAEILSATLGERIGVYEEAAARIHTIGSYVEKDLWVCAVLDALFGAHKPRCGMWFKGGTSLSKCYSVIQRFSEDIDVVLDRDALGFANCPEFDYTADVSAKQRKRAFEELTTASARYVASELAAHVQETLARELKQQAKVVVDKDDDQTLLVAYESAYRASSDYIPAVVRIECGARSAALPVDARAVVPFIQNDVEQIDFRIPDVPTISAGRTFWEKALILHGHHCRYRDEGKIPQEANRLSRHYYDVAMLSRSPEGSAAMKDLSLLAGVRSHNEIAFPSAWRRYDEAVPGTILLTPPEAVAQALRGDYKSMQTMIFGEPPLFDDILKAIETLHEAINTPR